MILYPYQCDVVDPKWGDTLWSERIDAASEDAAIDEARQEYEAYVREGYEPGSYKAEAVLDRDVTVRVKRIWAPIGIGRGSSGEPPRV